MTPKIVNEGKTLSLADVSLTGSGSHFVDFTLHASTVLMSVFVRSVSGTVTVRCHTFTQPNEQTEVLAFPTVSAPTSELLLKKAAVALANCKLEIQHTGACELQVVAKGLGAGELNVKLIGAATATARSVTVTNTAALIVPASLVDRSGLLIKNLSSAVVYIGFTASEATASNGYPLAQDDTLSIDLAAGQAVYAIRANAGTSDLRLIEALN